MENSDLGGCETLETPNSDSEVVFILERFILQVKVEVTLFKLESVFC